jgi:hypothetical protein
MTASPNKSSVLKGFLFLLFTGSLYSFCRTHCGSFFRALEWFCSISLRLHLVVFCTGKEVIAYFFHLLLDLLTMLGRSVGSSSAETKDFYCLGHKRGRMV